VPAAFVVGIIFVLLTVGLVFLGADAQGRVSEQQFMVLRVVLALGGAAFTMGISGFITVRLKLKYGLEITAGGSLAAFVILLVYTPAGYAVQVDPRTTSEQEVDHLRDRSSRIWGNFEALDDQPQRAPAVRTEALEVAEALERVSIDRLRPEYAVHKFEYEAFVRLIHASTPADPDDEPLRVQQLEQARLAAQATGTAEQYVQLIEETADEGEYERAVRDGVQRNQDLNRILWVRAHAIALLVEANVAGVDTCAVRQVYRRIGDAYRDEWRPAGALARVLERAELEDSCEGV
jgi:hypothetical protein